MVYTSEYASPLGTITLACDESAVIGLWFSGQKYFESTLPEQTCREEHPLIAEAKRWLDVYFSGREPDFLPPLRYDATPFRRLICDIMLTIPYGKTKTYGAIAAEAADIPFEVLQKVMSRIINEVRGVNRVFYDITSKPPGTIEFE